MEAAQLVKQLGGAVAAEREAAYEELFRLEEAHYELASRPKSRRRREIARIAVACTIPLCGVLTRPVVEVGVEEYHRASQLLVALSGVDPGRVGGETIRPGIPDEERQWKEDTCACCAVAESRESALGVVRAKDLQTLTREDALTVATFYGHAIVQYSTCTGLDAMTVAARMTGDEWLAKSFPGMWLMLLPKPDFNLALAPLLMDLLKESDQLPEFTLAGVLFAITHTLMAKPAVVKLLLDEHNAVAAFAGFIRQVTPEELVSAAGFSRRPHGTLMHAMKDLIEGAQAIGRDLTAQLLDIGYIDLLLDCLRSVPEVGWENCNGVVSAWGYMRTLNVVFGEKIEEIEEKLRKERAALRYVIDNNIIFMEDYGLQSSTMGMICAANLYGKDEDNAFGITQDEVDGFIDLDAELMACNSWGWIVSMGPNQGRGMLKLCISDTNKTMLIESPGFVEHMIASLLLDPNHPRRGGPPAGGASENTLACVQRDYAECIQQISLFPPGCEALKSAGVVQALDALVDKAWTEEAKDSARGALMQLTDRHREVVVEVDPDARWIMMSCACSLRSHRCRALQLTLRAPQTNGMSRTSSRGSWPSCSGASFWCGSTVRLPCHLDASATQL